MEELKFKLDNFPTCWADLTTLEKELMSKVLRPSGPFTEQQINFLANRWLPVDLDLLEQINNSLPPNTVVSATEDSQGKLWIGAYLLTNCMKPGDIYFPIRNILASLPITLLVIENESI